MNSILQWLVGSKAGELAGRGDWRIGLVADYSNYVKLALLAVLAGMAYLTIRSYRREGEASGRVKAILAAIRIAVIVLVMVMLFKPAIVLDVTNTIHSRIVVLIDDSLSMSFTDRYADADQRAKLSSFLDLSQDATAEGEPNGGASSQPARESVTDMSRGAIVRAALLRQGGALARLAQDHPLTVMAFSPAGSDKSYTRELGAVSEMLGDSDDRPETPRVPEALDKALGRLASAGHETNIRRALHEALDSVRGRRVAAVVVIGDGQVTVQSAGLGGARDYAAKRGVPVFAVCVGDPTPPKDLAVVALQAPRHVRAGALVEFSVALAHRNLAGQSATIRLLKRADGETEWIDTGASETVELIASSRDASRRGDTGVQTAVLHVEPDKKGLFIYKAVVDARTDEQNTDNNSAEAPVEVSDRKINVLLVSSNAGWEFRFLRNVLLRSPELYRLSVWQQNADKEINQVASTGMKLERLPGKLEELIGSPGGKPHPGYDVVILYDPEPTTDGFDGAFVDMLKKFVQRHGKGVCYMAGNRHSDILLSGRGPYKAMTDMLPVVLAANTFNAVARIELRRPEPWPVKLSSYGADHPITHLGVSAEETRNIWSVLPGVFWTHPVYKSKPTARVLLSNTNPLRRTGDNRPEPVLAIQSYGKGRVVYVGLDATWRWRYMQHGFYHRRFWGNVVRYLATLGSRRLVITTGGDRFAAGERITVEVEAYDQEYKPLDSETFRLRMVRIDTGGERTIDLAGVANRLGHYKATIDAPAAGVYELGPEANYDMGDAQEKLSRRITVEPPQAETARREADEAMMRTVASRPGNFLWIRDVDALADLIPPGKLTTIHPEPEELWDSRLSLLLIVVLLAVEWALRKKHNMA